MVQLCKRLQEAPLSHRRTVIFCGKEDSTSHILGDVKRLIIIIAAVLAPLGWSQSIPISGQVFNQYGSPVAGAQVYICSAAGSSGLPCSPVASIYQDYNLSTPISNPTQTDANGNFSVYVGPLAFPNTYVVNAVPQSGTTYTWLFPGPSCPLSGCTFTGNVKAPIFNATSTPYYEINGVQISSSALSDAANLAKLNASNTFTGTTQTAPVWNATSGFTVGGTALASTNLSDSANLAKLNASNTFTGATNTFAAVTGTTINATSGFQVGGTALSASNLSNGVSGTGAVCLASGSACASSGTVSSVGITSSTSTQLTVSGSPVTSSGSITLGLNLTGTEAKLVTAAGAGTATHIAVWDSSSGIGDGGQVLPSFTGTSGYQVEPSGLIFEWATFSDPGNQTPATSSLPFNFPHACFKATFTAFASGSDYGEDISPASLGCTTTTVSYYYSRNSDHSGMTVSIQLFAIGW